MITLHPAWNQTLIQTQRYITLYLNLITPISKPHTNLPTPNPAHLHFPNLPYTFNLFNPKSKLKPFPSLYYFKCNTHIFPLHSQSIISSNPPTPTPSLHYTPSQNSISSSTRSSNTNRAYRAFKRKFSNIPFPSNPGTSTTFVNHRLHTNRKKFSKYVYPFPPVHIFSFRPQ